MELVWQTTAWEDYLYWQEQDKKLFIALMNSLRILYVPHLKELENLSRSREIFPVFGVDALQMNIGWYMPSKINDYIYFNADFIIINFGGIISLFSLY